MVVWSAILAVRALWRGHSARWPTVVLALCAFEAAAVCLCLWPTNLFSFSVPVFVLASALGVVVAWWHVLRAEKRDRAACAAPWLRRRCVKRGVVWYLCVTALMLAIMLPTPLFLHCALMGVGDQSGWRKWTVEHTPIVVGEVAVAILAPMKKNVTARLMYYQTLSSGRVARERLFAELSSSNPSVSQSAIIGLLHADPAGAMDVVNRLANGTFPGASSALLWGAGTGLGLGGSTEQIRCFLDPAREPRPPSGFLRELINTASGVGHPELLADLARFWLSDSPDRDVALAALARKARPEDAERYWAQFLADSDPERRSIAITAIGLIPDLKVRFKILLAALDKPDQALHCELATRLRDLKVIENILSDRRLRVRVTKILLPLLDGEYLIERRRAIWWLAVMTHAETSLLGQCETLTSQSGAISGDVIPPETMAEHELVKKVRAEAIKWLEENDK